MNAERLENLIGELLDERLSASGREELQGVLRSSASARQVFWELVEHEALLHDVVCESAGRDLARMAADDLAVGEPCVRACAAPAAVQGPASTRVRAGGLVATGVLLASAGWLAAPLLQSATWRADGAASGEPVATLSSLAGEVWRTDAAQKSSQASSAQSVYPGDRVRVGEEAAAELTLADGSRVVLGARSVLHFDRVGPAGKALRLECGSAAVEAAPQPAGRPLVIDTEQARLTVLGTRFRLYAGQGDSRVELEEGKVQFERRSDGTSVEVGAGQYAVAANGNSPSQPPEVRELSADWRLRQTLLRAGGQAAFSHDGVLLATSHGEGVKVWEVATGELRHAARDMGAFTRLAFTPANDAIVAIRNDGQVAHWPLSAGRMQLQDLAAPGQRLRLCAVSRDGRWLAQTSSDDAGHLPIWRVGDGGEMVAVRSIPRRMSSVAIAATPSGPRVVAGNLDGTTITWDALSGEELSRHRLPAELTVLTLSDDGRLECGYSVRTGLVAVDTVSGKQTTFWPGDSVRVHAVRLSRDGRELFAAMADGLVRAWSTESGDATFALPTGDVAVTALDVSADGRWLATCGARGDVKIWQRSEDMRSFAP
jgi:hypothetical protein